MLQLERIDKKGYAIELFVPNAMEVQEAYLRDQPKDFPHWTKIWPSALAMADFIYEHPNLVQGKTVLELAAGLGLPSLLAARYAARVWSTDYLEEAVAAIARSAAHSGLSNVYCEVVDWNFLPSNMKADVLLLSDVNYDPNQFDRLYEVLQAFIKQGTVILLATPQRLMAKSFVERLLGHCKEQHVVDVDGNVISLLVL